jgi:multisubunit Na+/H+ antiporter MnhG subunit
MIERLTSMLQSITWGNALLGVGLFLASLLISFAAIGIVMVKVPPHYFSARHDRDFLPDSPWLVRWGAVIAKNIAGVFLILLGIILSLPGVPGQGILTILLGLIFLDIPGKRPLEARIIKRPSVLSAINKLRAKYDKPPLELD